MQNVNIGVCRNTRHAILMRFNGALGGYNIINNMLTIVVRGMLCQTGYNYYNKD